MPIKNQRYTITIDDLSAEGAGIGRINGFTMFVKGALPGETVEVLAVKVKKSYAYGKLLRVLVPSAARVSPVCPVFGKCGGCGLQHMRYQEQLDYKTDKVAEALRRISGLRCAVLPTIGMSEPFAYRNKAQFPVGVGSTAEGSPPDPVIGFYAERSHRIVDFRECALQPMVHAHVLTVLENFIRKHRIKPYDEERHTGLIRHVLIRTGAGEKAAEVMVCVVVNGENLPHAAELIQELRRLDGMTSVALNRNTQRTNVILGEHTETLWGNGFIMDRIASSNSAPILFRISPQSFFQVNPAQTGVLYEIAATFAGLGPNDVVLDVYCGIGSIALYIAGKVKKVYGIEIVPQAIADARANAELNGIGNATFVCGAAETELPVLLHTVRKEHGSLPDVVILDPPRKGCDPRVLEAVVQSGVERLVYVSCDPATLARDVKILAAGGYRLEKTQPVDFFPMTVHVETVALLSRTPGNRQ